MHVIEVFSQTEMASLMLTIEQKIDQVKASITRLFESGILCVCAYTRSLSC
jgi:hypothetical protein